MSACRRSAGRLFHSFGPAAAEQFKSCGSILSCSFQKSWKNTAANHAVQLALSPSGWLEIIYIIICCICNIGPTEASAVAY